VTYADIYLRRLYWASANPFTWRDHAQTINAELIKIGKLPSTATKAVSVGQDEPLLWWARTNTRPLPTRAEKEFGWKPHRPSFATMYAEQVETYLQSM
jgi:hypothetical protein